MPPRSPLPRRHGLDAAWVRTLDSNVDAPWETMGAYLRHRLPDRVDVVAKLAAGDFVDATGRHLTGDEPYRPNYFIWFHRTLRDEPEVPFAVPVVYRDERIVVVDKPPFLATIPRGRHVTQSVVVRLRGELDLPDLAPAHRLDRLTSGLLLLTTGKRWRAPYQRLFADRAVAKTYTALACVRPDLTLPSEVSNHLRKRRGHWQVDVVADAPANAHTRVELVCVDGAVGTYRLTPTTGQTHQLRRHLCDLGIPIINDPLYPSVVDVDIDDFSHPLELLAAELAFSDPISQRPHHFISARKHGRLTDRSLQ